MAARAFDATIVVERSNGPRMVAWTVACLLGLVVMFGGIHVNEHAASAPLLGYALMVAGIGLAALATVQLILASQKQRIAEERIQASERCLRILGEKPLPPVTTAHYQPRKGAASTVRISFGFLRSTLDVVVANESVADELMSALGFDPARSIARFAVKQGIFANKRAQTGLSLLLTAGGWNIAHLLPPHYRLPSIGTMVVVILLNALPSTIAVGPDGLLVRSTFRRVFYAYSSIERAEPSEWGVTLVMKSGKRVELRTNNKQSESDETRDALLLRIRRGLGSVDTAAHRADISSSLLRGGRSIEQWMRALEALGDETPGYRIAAVPHEELWRVVVDPAAEPTARAGAAAALRRSLDEDGRARLVAAAESTVHPKVRLVLEAAASTTPQAKLEEAMLACDDDANDEHRGARS